MFKQTVSKMRQFIGTGIVVVNSSGEILLGKRLNAYKSGTFGLPGGRLEVGEPLIDSVKRELLEETSIVGIVFKYLGVVREWQGTHDFIHFGFLCIKFTGEPKVRESKKCESWDWFPLNLLPQPLLPGHAVVIELYIEYSKNQLT